MDNEYKGIVVFIPTRNRASMAMWSIESALEGSEADLRVVVSDNSTDEKDLEQLKSFCENYGDQRLSYIRPPEQLAMALHWDWLIGHLLQTEAANHFRLLTDRFLLKEGAVTEMKFLAQSHPDKAICYGEDLIYDDSDPVKMGQVPWSGSLFEISSKHLLRLSSEYCRGYATYPLPKAGMTGIMTRTLYEAVKKQFASYTAGTIAPDYGFGFRVLGVCDSILFYDKSLQLNHGQKVSNGRSIMLGVFNKATKDFIAQTGRSEMYYEGVPIPNLQTTTNTMVYEYCLAKKMGEGLSYPELSLDSYLESEAYSVSLLKDPALRAEMEILIQEHGGAIYLPKRAIVSGNFSRKISKLLSPAKWINKFFGTERHKELWMKLNALFGWTPPEDNHFGFATGQEAMEYMRRFPRKPCRYRHEILWFLWNFPEGWKEISGVPPTALVPTIPVALSKE
jgi:hypothetical protein